MRADRSVAGWILAAAIAVVSPVWLAPASAATNWTVLGWNNLGMHCMDNDFSVFSILPPYNTIHAQIVMGTSPSNQLIVAAGDYSVAYQAIADTRGSSNATSVGKGNFWDYALPLYGASPAPDTGLAVQWPTPFAMPGATNTPRAMGFESNLQWFVAYGIPITPYDDTQRHNAYPMMRLIAKKGGVPVATNDIVLPVSDEMDCRLCHASGSGVAARPAAGWVYEPDPTRDYRLNVLRLHDERQSGKPAYANALATNGYNAAGLYANVTLNGRPILCAACHKSEALPGSGLPGLTPLTRAVHNRHASVVDPVGGGTLESDVTRGACYRCHPGAVTRCLRGAMGRAVDSNGVFSIQCQDCHGSMSNVGATNRTGWLDEPKCQSCHTGTATNNNGQIRYDNAFVSPGVWRVATNQTFATDPDVPAAGYSLFRFSRGHGNLYCSACHGSTHAEFPTSEANDNVRNLRVQGHKGQMVECSVCHGSSPQTGNGGPHGMHPVGSVWVKANVAHRDYAGTVCRGCHGTNSVGTVLSRTHTDRVLTNKAGNALFFWRGRQVGCYECHNGPDGIGAAPAAPTVTNVAASTAIDTPVAVPLLGSTNRFRIVSQPAHGTVALAGTVATYYPESAFAGTDTFSFAAFSNRRDSSNLASCAITVAGGPCGCTLAPTNQTFGELGGMGIVSVSTGGSCPWSAASDYRWITVFSSGGSSGSAAVVYGVERNTNSAPRSGTLTIGGQTVTVTQAGAPADANGDGIPDAWQTLYFGSAGSTNAVPGADPDGDGASNLQEYLAGTRPDQSNSVFRVTALVPTGGLAEVQFTTSSNRLYQVQRRDSLTQGVWQGFTNAVLGTGGVLPVDDPVAGVTSRFYRVRLAP